MDAVPAIKFEEYGTFVTQERFIILVCCRMVQFNKYYAFVISLVINDKKGILLKTYDKFMYQIQ